MEQAAKARVFLSYGHRDASALAQRLHDGLRAIGHAVWMDRSELRAGLAWSEAIADGVRDAQVLVALMSPASVRRASLRSPADDSVCLDEIAYAVDGRKLPVVPVMAQTCEPPFRISRLQYLDFRRADRSPQQFRRLLAALAEAIDQAAATGSVPLRVCEDLPPPWDFEPLWAEKRRDFVGRQWLFEAIGRWRDGGGPSLLITGLPGVGKSALVAELVHRNPGGLVLACHACQADTPATLDPAQFVRNLVGQLGLQLPGYAQMLQTPALRARLQPAKSDKIDKDPASDFDALVLGPLVALPAPTDGPRCLLIDGLDEALSHRGWHKTEGPDKTPSSTPGLNIVDLLASHLPRFPPWLRLLATTRPELAVSGALGALARQTLAAEHPDNLLDLACFVRDGLVGLFGAPEPDAVSDPRVSAVAQLMRAADGNFLVAKTALDALRAGHLGLTDLAQLPPGLSSQFRLYFNRLYAPDAAAFGQARQLLEAVLAAPAPPSRALLAAVLGWDDDSLLPVLGRLASFLEVRNGCYRLYHKSLADWLTGWHGPSDQPLAGAYHARVQRGHALWADHWLAQRDAQPLPAGLLQSLPGHLCGASRWDDLGALLLDGRFVAAKLAGPHTRPGDLLGDLVQALRQWPAGLREREHALLTDLRRALERQGQQLDRAGLRAFDQLLLQTEIDGRAALRRQLLATGPAWGLGAAAGLPRWQLDWASSPPDPALRRTWRFSAGFAHGLALSADGRLAATGDDAGQVFVVDLDTGDIVQQIQAHADRVWHCALSGDGRRLASCDQNGAVVKVWDARSGELCCCLPTAGLEPEALRLTADGAALLTANQGEGAPCLSWWATDGGQARRDFHAPGLGPAWDAAIAGTAGRLLSAHVDGLLCLWDLHRGALIDRIRVARVEGYWSACDIAADGRLALAGTQGVLVVWDIAAGTLRRAPPAAWGSGDVFGLCADARRVVSGAGDGLLLAWDLDPDHAPRLLYGHTRNELWSAGISGDGRRALSAVKGGQIIEWDLDRLDLPHQPAGHGEWIDNIAISADGRWLATLGETRLKIWGRTGRLVREFSVRQASGLSGELGFDETGAWVRFQNEGRETRWPVDGGSVVYRRAGSQVPDAASDAVSMASACAAVETPDLFILHHRRLAQDRLLLVGDDGSVLHGDLASGQPLYRLCLGEISCAASSADGRWVALGNGAGEIFVLDLGVVSSA